MRGFYTPDSPDVPNGIVGSHFALIFGEKEDALWGSTRPLWCSTALFLLQSDRLYNSPSVYPESVDDSSGIEFLIVDALPEVNPVPPFFEESLK